MSSVKSGYWQALKAAGVKPERRFVDYTVPELQALCAEHLGEGFVPEPKPATPPVQPVQAAPAGAPFPDLVELYASEVVEVDDQGRHWLQREVRKPVAGQPRGYRVLRYDDPGVKVDHVKNEAGVLETIELPGTRSRPLEAKIILPSYQTGIYVQRGIPFRIHTYQDASGFNREDVENYYGGTAFVPPTVQRVYAGTDLCYDMQSVINDITLQFNRYYLS